MDGKDSPAGGCCLILLCVLFMIGGACIFGVSVWILVDDNFGYITDVLAISVNADIKTAAYVSIGVGILLILSGFAGCAGSASKNNALLCCFIFCSLTLLCGEFAGGILASMYKTQVGDKIQNNLYASFSSYRPKTNESSENGVAIAWDHFQVWFDCCGANDYKDYRAVDFLDPEMFVPETCCALKHADADNPDPVNNTVCQFDASTTTASSQYLHTKGCSADIRSKANVYVNWMIAVAFTFTFLQMLVLVFACCAFCGGGGSGRGHFVCRWRCC